MIIYVIGLEALECTLSIVENHSAGVKSEGTVGDDPRVVPAVLGVIIDNYHIVGKYLSESKIVHIGFLFKLFSFLKSDVHNFYLLNYMILFKHYQSNLKRQ